MRLNEAFQAAFHRMKRLLFQPFNLTFWMTLGFLAWLAFLGEGFGGGSFQLPTGESEREMFRNMFSGFDANAWNGKIVLIAVLATIAVLVIIGIFLFVLWIKCRGRFMLLDALVRGVNSCPLKERFRNFRKQGNSYFLFSLLFGAISLLLVLPFLGGIVLFFVSLFGKTGFPLWGGILSLAIALILGILLFFYGAALLLFQDMGTLLMYKKDLSAFEAIRPFCRKICEQPWIMVKYLIGRTLLTLGCHLLVLIFELLTCLLCCIGFILMGTPYVWAVAALPLLCLQVFFNLEYAKNLGPDYTLPED